MLEWLTLGNLKTFLEVLEKARNLARDYSSADEKMFDDVLEPLFLELQKVVDDYFLLFRVTLDDVSAAGNKAEFNQALAKLRENREKMLSARIVVRETAAEMAKLVHREELNNFLQKIEKVFFSVEVAPQKRRLSYSVNTLTLLEALEQDEVPKEMVVETLKTTIEAVEAAFVAVAQSYAHLRLAYRAKRRRFT